MGIEQADKGYYSASRITKKAILRNSRASLPKIPISIFAEAKVLNYNTAIGTV
jgi:hypothetical protein